MIEARYHDSVNVLQEMFGAPGPAHDAAPPGSDIGYREAACPFDRPQWYALLAQTGMVPLIATAQDGQDCAALALSEQAGRITPMRNWYSFTWRPLTPAGERGDRPLNAIARHLRGRAHRVTLAPVPEEDGCASRLAHAFGDAGWRVEVSRCDTNHILAVKGRSFAQYWASRPGPLRTTLKRKGKRVIVTLHDRFVESAWDEYEAVYAASWKPVEGEPAMLRAFARAEADAGRLRLGIAHDQGQAVAAQFWTIDHGTAYIHKLAHLESHRHLSAGTILSAAMFERAIDTDRVALVDFGTGDEPYKRDWMEAIRPRYQIDCLDLRQPKAWIDLARLALRRTREADIPALAPVPIDG